MSIIANLMAMIEDDRICIETTGSLRGHTTWDPGFYCAPHNPWATTNAHRGINWEEVLLKPTEAAHKSPFEQGMIDAHRAISEAAARAIQAETDYLNEILAKFYSKPALTSQQWTTFSTTITAPGITISDYS